MKGPAGTRISVGLLKLWSLESMDAKSSFQAAVAENGGGAQHALQK